jgi:hypothetical protein
MERKNKDIDPIYPLIIAYLLTIAIVLAWEILTNK